MHVGSIELTTAVAFDVAVFVLVFGVVVTIVRSRWARRATDERRAAR